MKFAATFLAASLISSAAYAQGQNFTINVGTDDRDGICRIYLPGDGMEVQISVRAEDGNTVVSVEKIPAEWTEGKEDKDVTLTLTIDNRSKFTVDEGAYQSGFNYRVIGAWEKKTDGQKILPLLKGGKTIMASFDGKQAGPFNIQAHSANIKDYAFTFMKGCLERNNSPVKL